MKQIWQTLKKSVHPMDTLLSHKATGEYVNGGKATQMMLVL